MLSRRRLIGSTVAVAAAGTIVGTSRSSAEATSITVGCAPRYLGYRGDDFQLPYAKFMASETLPAQPSALSALAKPAVPTADVPSLDFVRTDLSPTGYSALEYGYGVNAAGQVWVAILTDLPRNTPAMWDWWFGWHSRESARYKLWHPSAHAYASIKDDRSWKRWLTDKQRYVNNISYVDEYIGTYMEQLAIGFVEPSSVGFTVPADQTMIVGTVGSSIAGVNLGWLAHQVRPTATGAQMRSRFYLNVLGLGQLNLGQSICAISRGGGDTIGQPLPLPAEFGHELMEHCAREMNHLGTFLPELYAQFKNTR